MIAINYSTLRQNMKKYFDSVSDDYETMVITRKENKIVVVISVETYNNLIENAYLTSNQSNYNWLMESKRQLEEGKTVIKD